LPKTNNPKANLLNQIDEKLFRLLIDRIEDYAIFMLDPNGYILSWNRGAENMKGYTADEIIGQHIAVFYTEEDKQNDKPRDNLNKALKNGIHESEGWRIKKDGSRFWASIVFTTLYDENKHLIGFAKITRDITERKYNEEQKSLISAELENREKASTERIIASERRFRKLIENSYDGIALFDKNLMVFYRSRSAQRINGWTNVERSEQSFDLLVHPDDLEKVRHLFSEILVHPDRPAITTYRTMHKQGHYIWIECLLNNRLDDPDIGAIVCNFRDVTESVKAEEQIKDKNKQIENILDSITDGFIALDKDYNYTYANRKIGEMMNCDAKSLIGHNIWALYPDTVGSATYKAMQQARQTKQYTWNEDYYAPLDLWQENHIYPTGDGLSVFIRDITEKKQDELERERITTDLIQRNNDLEQFTYIVSHNLRAPVANIRGLSEMLADMEVAPGNENAKALKALSTSVCNLDKVILDLNNILQISSTTNDTLEMVSLASLIDEVKSATGRLAEQNRAVIHYDFSGVAKLMSLKSYLYSIFQNLIVNSIKYKRPDTDPVINISSNLEGDKVCIYFSDNGKGIDLERYRTHLFGLYKRFDLSVEGKGIGLFMVKMQVERLGGTISVQSRLNAGTEFKLEFPLKAGNR
jgi:PAS domain S-box-containing protein